MPLRQGRPQLPSSFGMPCRSRMPSLAWVPETAQARGQGFGCKPLIPGQERSLLPPQAVRAGLVPGIAVAQPQRGSGDAGGGRAGRVAGLGLGLGDKQQARRPRSPSAPGALHCLCSVKGACCTDALCCRCAAQDTSLLDVLLDIRTAEACVPQLGIR